MSPWWDWVITVTLPIGVVGLWLYVFHRARELKDKKLKSRRELRPASPRNMPRPPSPPPPPIPRSIVSKEEEEVEIDLSGRVIR